MMGTARRVYVCIGKNRKTHQLAPVAYQDWRSGVGDFLCTMPLKLSHIRGNALLKRFPIIFDMY